MATANITLSLRISQPLYKWLKRQARADGRSMNETIALALQLMKEKQAEIDESKQSSA